MYVYDATLFCHLCVVVFCPHRVETLVAFSQAGGGLWAARSMQKTRFEWATSHDMNMNDDLLDFVVCCVPNYFSSPNKWWIRYVNQCHLTSTGN